MLNHAFLIIAHDSPELLKRIINNVKVPKENMLRREGEGFEIALKALDGGRIGIGAQSVGIAQGALNEAMQYVTTEKAKGVCPANSHIPSDAEWKTLEMQLGMTQAQADATGWRGTDQGTQLKSGGGSGINVLLAGHRNNGGPFGGMSSSTDLWSSSESSSSAWSRYLSDGYATVDRDIDVKVYGFSVRCLRN